MKTEKTLWNRMQRLTALLSTSQVELGTGYLASTSSKVYCFDASWSLSTLGIDTFREIRRFTVHSRPNRPNIHLVRSLLSDSRRTQRLLLQTSSDLRVNIHRLH